MWCSHDPIVLEITKLDNTQAVDRYQVIALQTYLNTCRGTHSYRSTLA